MKKADIKKWAKLAVILAVFATLLLLPKPSQLQVAYGQGYGYSGAVGGGLEPTPVEGDVSDSVDADGEFTSSATLTSADGQATLVVPRGTIGLTAEGEPLSSLTISHVHPPAPPPGTNTIGINFDIQPSGATFDPPAELTFDYNPNWLPPGATPDNLTIAYYNESGTPPGWVELGASDIVFNPDGTITANIHHLTVFSILVRINPAAFEISGLVVPTTAINVAEKATISAMLKNTGDLAGTTRVTLKINGVEVSYKNVKLAGDEMRKVSFETVQGKPGSYKVDIDGLSGTFTVKAVPVKPVVITSTVPSVTAPSVEYPAPTAPVPPAVPAPVPAPTPWLAIIISLVATVIVAVIIVWYYGFRTQY